MTSPLTTPHNTLTSRLPTPTNNRSQPPFRPLHVRLPTPSSSAAEAHHGSSWESSKVDGNGLSPHWQDETFELLSSHPEIAQAVLSIGYRVKPSEKPRALAVASVPLDGIRSGVRCLTMRDPKHGENGRKLRPSPKLDSHPPSIPFQALVA